MDPLISFPLKLRNRHFFIIDLMIFLVTPLIALVLRTDGLDAIDVYHESLITTTLVFLVIKVAIFYKGGLYTRFWRYASIDELTQITILGLMALVAQTLVFFLVLRPFAFVTPFISDDFPRSVPLIEGLLALIAVGGVRFSVPVAAQIRQKRLSTTTGERVLVAGAGVAGVMMVQEMQNYPRLGMRPVAFVDDAPLKQGARIRGVPVMGKCSDIARVAREAGANQVIIAMPTAPGKMIRQIVNLCEQAGVKTKIIPGIYELLDGTASVKQLRDVRIEDLLRREPVQTDISAVSELLKGKTVLVTGGGGSIGSELCRQVLRFQPKSLVILGHGENSVFEIHNELTRWLEHGLPAVEGSDETPEVVRTKLHTVIADIRFADRMQAIFREHQPDVVFHAAAHKHVPLMEMNPVEAITNNVLGTRNLLDAARAVGVEHFVMISTDKAVNPTSMMGASKRAAELLVHRAAHESGKAYVAVRFGNVLGSRGSVVLSFRQQIAAGGPVTVTHQDMVRYFMTIPEAVQLVLQAAPLGHGGEVFMLDMGEPIKIVDLARDLIELSGLEVGRDIDIAFTGMRPGEKLFEEMFLASEKYERTQHEKIFIAGNGSTFVPHFLDRSVQTLEQAAQLNDKTAILLCLQDLIREFKPVGRGVEGNGKHPVGVRALELEHSNVPTF